MNHPIYVGSCELGRGVFAARPFDPGDLIVRLSGVLLTAEEVAAKGEDSMNTLQVAPRLYLELDPPTVFFNHSCEPNTGIRDSLFVVALRAIARDEEIRFDYSTTMDEDLETMDCRCGMPACRRVVRDFITLPDHLQQRYLALGVVQPFIVGLVGSKKGNV